MRGLKDKVIVVAGGGTGGGGANIGAATCLRLAAEGAKVVVGGIHEAMAKATVELIADEGGVAVACQFDASDEASIRNLIDVAVAQFGGLDGVHFNAADMSTVMADAENDICTVPLEIWNRTLAVDLTGYMLTARYAIPRLLERGGGGIVGTGSVAIYAGQNKQVSYATAKTAMTAVTRHIATAYGQQGIRANLVAPGRIWGHRPPPDAEMAKRVEQIDRENAILIRSNRDGQPEDIAAAVTFLLSEDGSYINGQTLLVDGGMYLGR
jgi:NAD(P)-dependent dehydrogenase (short-subunit alcohol dehydrogenase family)